MVMVILLFPGTPFEIMKSYYCISLGIKNHSATLQPENLAVAQTMSPGINSLYPDTNPV